jgi:hypothetical protein
VESRNQTSYQTLTYDFLKYDVLVCCPRCDKKAVVKPVPSIFPSRDEDHTKVSCTECGFNKKLSELPESLTHPKKNNTKEGRQYRIGGPVDPWFHLPLWLQQECLGNLLWAYNPEHIDYLISHIGAKLRERNGQDLANKSLGSRLPRWMTSKNNRETILKELQDLKDKKDSG